MAENSNIEWTHHTFNPWIGCQKVGPGCDHCYAEAWDARGLQQREGRWGAHAARTRTSTANWRKPLAWDKAAKSAGERHRVFCASLADVFDKHASILPEWRADLWALIKSTPNLDWMLLTKRPGNIAKMLPEDWGRGYRNVWLGCTVVNQEEADRDVPKLLALPAAVRFLSMEPLLGPVDLNHIRLPHGSGRTWIDALQPWWVTPDMRTRLDLVIVGGESGPGARPMHPDWARSLRDQCVAAGAAFHFKQWGEWAAGDAFGMVSDKPVTRKNGEVKDWMDRYVTTDEWGARLQGHTFTGHSTYLVYRVGKKAAGRLLDGRTWDQMPVEGEA